MNGYTDVETPLQGIQPENLTGLPSQPQQDVGLGEEGSANVRLQYYGRNFGENNRDANYGPDGSYLQDHHVAVSPDTAKQLGLNLGDWVWVGPQLRQYQDYSYRGPGRPNSATVEVRDYPADGRTTLRKATDEEVESSTPTSEARGRPSAMTASMLTGKPLDQLTGEDFNRIIQEYPRIAGEPTAESIEAAGVQQPAFTQPVEEPSQMEAAGGVGMGGAGVGYGGEDTIVGDMSVPDPARARLDHVDPVTGTRIFNKGTEDEIRYHPSNDTLEWSIGGRTFLKQGPYGKTISSYKTWRDPLTGRLFNISSGRMVEMTAEGQSPAYDRNLSVADNLKHLSPEDASTVQMFVNYQMPMMTRYGRVNPDFARLRAYVNAVDPSIDPRTYQLRQQTMLEMASDKPNSPGGRLNSWNQALIHAGNLWDLASKVPEGQLPAGNTVANWVNTNIKGLPAERNFEAQAHFFANEVEKAITGGVPSVTEVDKLEKLLSAAGSKAQVEGVLRNVFAKTISGGLERVNFGYKRNMGKDYPTDKLIAAEAADSLNKFGIHSFAGRDISGMQGPSTTGMPGPGQPAPSPYKSGDSVTLKDGSVRTIDKILPDGRVQFLPLTP